VILFIQQLLQALTAGTYRTRESATLLVGGNCSAVLFVGGAESVTLALGGDAESVLLTGGADAATLATGGDSSAILRA
jgi:hypothetical protein